MRAPQNVPQPRDTRNLLPGKIIHISVAITNICFCWVNKSSIISGSPERLLETALGRKGRLFLNFSPFYITLSVQLLTPTRCLRPTFLN